MRRTDLHGLAQSKLDDALLLLSNHRWSNAYYLAGYAVEIGLKGCTARQIVSEVIPDKKFINDIHTHQFQNLVGVAGLRQEHRERMKSDPNFAANWAIVAEWTPDVRYQTVDPYSAQLMLQAVNEPSTGVLEWIKAYW